MTEPTPDFDFTQFPGYSIPNTTQIPDEFLDHHMAFLSGAEVKVMLYIFRRTLGFKRHADNISLNQMLSGIVKRDGTRLDFGTGLSKSTLLGALKTLVEKRLVLIEQRQSSERGNEPSTYRLNFAPPLVPKIDLGESENHTPLVPKIDLGLVPKIAPPLVLKIDPTTNSITTNSETKNSTNNREAAPTPSPDPVVVGLLTSHGIGRGAAQTLATDYPETRIRQQVAFLEFLRQERPTEVQKPAAWLRRAIEQDFAAPDGFVSEAERQRQAEAENSRKQAVVAAQKQAEERAQAQREIELAQKEERRQKLLTRYTPQPTDVALWQAVKDYLQNRNEQGTAALLADSEVLKRENGSLLIGFWNDAAIRQLSHPRIQALLKRGLKHAAKEPLDVAFMLLESVA